MKKRTLRTILKLCDMVDENMRGRGDALAMALQSDEVRQCLKREKTRKPIEDDSDNIKWVEGSYIALKCGSIRLNPGNLTKKQKILNEAARQIRFNGGVERKPNLP